MAIQSQRLHSIEYNQITNIDNSSLYTILYIICLGQMVFQTYIPILQFWDETLTIIFLFVIILTYLRNGNVLGSQYYKMFFLIILIAAFGIAGNHINRIQTKAIPILNDLGNCFKVYIAYIGSVLYFSYWNVSYITKLRTIKKCAKFTRILVLIMLIFAIINLFVDIGMRQELRFGIPTFQFIVSGSGNFSGLFFPILLVLTADYYCCQRTKKKLFIILALLVWASAIRIRGFVHIFVYLSICYYIVHLKKNKINLFAIIVSLIVIYFIVNNQVHYYIDEGTTARYYLIYGGFQTAANYFPLGGGFATFGTDAAAKYYSRLYDLYGFENVWGLSSENPVFAKDNYWPAVMGEFGFIGLAFTIILIYMLFSDIFRLSGNNIHKKAIAYFICIALVFQSSGSPVFFHYNTVNLLIILSFVLTINKQPNRFPKIKSRGI